MIYRDGKARFVTDDKSQKQMMLDEVLVQAKTNNGKTGLIAVATAVIAIQSKKLAIQRLVDPLAAAS